MSTTLHPSAQNGFSQHAELYQKSRPSYPPEIIDWLRHDLGLNAASEVIDLGAGTGKFIPYLKQITSRIQAIEPISEMLEQLKIVYPNIHCIQTDSHNLKLPLNSIDAILCAQSFHWFADQASVKEIHQVLKPHASLGLIWNQRDTRFPWIKALAEFLIPLEGDTPRYHHGTWQTIFENSNLFRFESEHTFSFQHTGTVEQVVVQRILSTSFVAASSIEKKEYIRYEVLKIVKDHLQKDLHDIVNFPYITHAYHYRKQ